MPREAKNSRIVRKIPKGARINVRLDQDTLDGLKTQAAKVGGRAPPQVSLLLTRSPQNGDICERWIYRADHKQDISWQVDGEPLVTHFEVL